jgi:hypothetical protein
MKRLNTRVGSYPYKLFQATSNASIRTKTPEIYGDFSPSKSGSTAACQMNDVRNPTRKATMVQNAI